MKKNLFALIMTIYVVISSTATAIPSTQPLKKVLVIQAVDHPALNMTTQGIIEGLETSGFTRGVNLELRIESAQANYAVAAQIANKFVHQKPDVAVGVGTMSAQVFIKYAAANQVKLVFSSVTDPLAAHIVKTLSHPGNNTSGVSNFVPLKPQLELFKALKPNLKRLGIIYNPAEINSISIVKQLEIICSNMDIKLIKQTVAKTADVVQSAVKLAAEVDAIFISNDNTALSSFQSVVRTATKDGIPVYVSDTDAVAVGALAALGPNQREVGRQTGMMIAKVLSGTDINTLPVEFPVKTNIFINLRVAKQLGIIVPDEILAKATTIIEGDN